HLNLNNTDWNWEWMQDTPVKIGDSTYFVATATYNEVLKPGALTEISLSQIALDPTATNADVEAFGETYQVLVKTQGIQADGFDDPNTALNEGFGSKIPFENDNPIKGIDLRTALHNLNGDTTQVITSKVSNVIYALNEEYPEIVDGYEGTLVDVEQDVPVYAYYVPNGSNFDVYFLADDTIYSPKDSSGLYKNMRALQYVDTHNYDVSRVENMHELFRYCHSLKDIDVSEWDVSNVKDMFSVFDECKVLPKIDVSKWDTGKAETMAFMFYGCSVLQTVDVSEWNVSNVASMRGMFEQCNALADIDVADWDTGNVTDMAFMFKACFALKWIDVSKWDTGNVTAFNSMFSDSKSNRGRMQISGLDFSNWDTSNATNMGYMFYGCGTMESIDLSGWDVSKVTTMNHMFCDCYKMQNYNFSGWNTESLTIMNGMFNNNDSLKVVDVSDFDTQNVYDFVQVFDACYSLETIIGLDKWDTSSADRFVEFLTSTKVREIDLSSFDASNVKYMSRMFYNNSQLTTIYVGDKWNFDISTLDTTSGNASYSGMGNMFESNPNLVGGNGSTPADFGTSAAIGAIYGCVDTDETPGLLTHIKDKPVEEPTE
ncbi:MAG: BspA family leucine-rich repeat surface protein, partial [Bacteroidaceae bacterium]|nr:BspA family leucine-rich repeat surface protein [Bacteroidaceae bacterium]